MIKVGSDFSGVGAFNQALIRLGIKYEEVFACDMDKYARQTFILNYGEPKYYPENVYEREIPLESLDIYMTSPPCFTGDTLVNTDFGFKKIENIKINDVVLTHNNRYRKVIDFGSKESEIYLLKAQGITETETTSNHRYFVREKYRKWNNEKRSDERLFTEPNWVETKDLTPNHFIGINIPLIEENHLNITKEIAYVLGRYVADGWLRDRTNDEGKTKGNCVVLAIGKDKVNGISEKIKLKYTLTKEVRGVCKLFISSNNLVKLIQDIQLGTGAINKRIPQSIINLPKDILQEFVNGYMDGDGHKRKDFYKATSVSKELLMGLQLCVAKLYRVNSNLKFIKTSDTTIIEGRTVNQRDYYVLEFRKEMRKQSKAKVIDNVIWYPIKSIKKTDYIKTVFDITVEEDHSFTANQAIVHNCQSFSLAGKRKGEDSKNGVLFYNSHEFIVKNNPRYFIFENVKGLLSDDSGKTFQKWIDYLGGKSINGNPVIFPHENATPYHVYYQVMNAKHYGVPQNRERIFIIGIRDDADNTFSFPKPFPLVKRLKDVLENQVNEKYFLSDKMMEGLIKSGDKSYINQDTQASQVYSENGTSPNICAGTHGYANGYVETSTPQVICFGRSETEKARRKETFAKTGKDSGSFKDKELIVKNQDYYDTLLANPNPQKEGLIMIPANNSKGYDIAEEEEDSINFSNPNSETRRGRVGHGVSQTLDTACNQGVLTRQRIRRLTERECFRLMDFSDIFMDKIESHNLEFPKQKISGSQLYKQAGNSIVVACLVELLKKLNL